MRVLHVIPGVAPRYGGPSRAIFEMCRALQTQACETLIATTDADGDGRLPVELNRTSIYKGVPTIFFSRQWSEAFKYSQPLSRWLDANVKNFDVVHIHAVFSHACLAAAKACRKHSIPYIVRPLGTLDPWSMRQKPVRKRVMWNVAGARMLRGAAAVHYTTLDEKQLAESSLDINHGVVIPLGVETEEFQNGAISGIFRQRHPFLGSNPYIVVLSRLHPKKNLELLMEAFLGLVKNYEFEKWRLILAGDGETEYVASLRRLVRDRGREDSVLFPGWLNGSEKVSALQNAALLALTSRQENFGICVIEALACGIPVLISEHVNLAREIESAGVGWVTSLEPSELSKMLADALHSDDERRKRGVAGRDFVVREFAWSHIGHDLTALYRSIVKTKSEV